MAGLLSGYEAYVALALTGAMFVAFLQEKFPPEVTAAVFAAVFVALGFVSAKETYGAFSNPAPIAIAAMFVLSSALVRTGVVEAAGARLVVVAGARSHLAVGAFLIAVAAASAFVNNTPLVLLLIPVALRLGEAAGLAPTQILIPLSYAAILGGTCSLIGTSSNLLIDGVARNAGLEPFSIFEISPVGVVATLVGLTTLYGLGRFLLPRRARLGGERLLSETEFLSEIAILDPEPFASAPLGKIAAFNRAGVRVLGVRRGAEILRAELDAQTLAKGDVLILLARTSELLTFDDAPHLHVGLRRRREAGGSVVEAVVAPHRRDVGARIADLDLGRRLGVRVLGAHRHKHIPGPTLGDVRLRPADKLLLEGPAQSLDQLVEEADLVSVNRPAGRAFRRRLAPIALLALGAVVALSALGVAEIGILAMIAVAAVLALRVLDADEAWGGIDAGVMVLLFAMLIIGKALDNSGAVKLIVTTLAPHLKGLPPILLIAAIYAIASIMTEIVTNNAVAVVLTPIAIGLAQQTGVDPRPFVVAVMMGASASFATPIGYQTNTLVYGAADYRFSDFLKIGVAMNLIVGAASVFAIALFFGA